MSVRDELSALRSDTEQILGVLRGRRPCKWGICHPEADCTCSPAEDDVDYARLRPVTADALGYAMLACRDLLKPVPATHWRQLGALAEVECVCPYGHRMTAGFQDCPCGRVFCFTGRRLYAIRDE